MVFNGLQKPTRLEEVANFGDTFVFEREAFDVAAARPRDDVAMVSRPRVLASEGCRAINTVAGRLHVLDAVGEIVNERETRGVAVERGNVLLEVAPACSYPITHVK